MKMGSVAYKQVKVSFVLLFVTVMLNKYGQAQYTKPDLTRQQLYGQQSGYGGYSGTYYPSGSVPPDPDRRFNNQQTPYPSGVGYDPYGRPVMPPGFIGPQQPPFHHVRFRGTCNFPNMAQLPQVVTVRTRLGEVMGKYEYFCDGPEMLYHQRRPDMPSQTYNNVSVFLGIPYAEAPIRERRFKPPMPFRGWSRLEAISFRPACPQPPGLKDNVGNPVPMDEDCLFLNIFVPSVVPSGEAYPVMIYIHGGEFESGTSAYFPGHMLAASMKVIVVTFNYRLGALGFLSTGDYFLPGNYGILDQVMAIQWVYNNIASFFGNPMKITLFGSDAGAASAGLHMLSPRSRDLFQNIIAQGGSPLADWACINNLDRARNTSRLFGERVGCDPAYSQRFVDCLRTRTARELTEINFKAQLGMFPWAPVVDKNISMLEQHRFLHDSPEELIRRGQFDKSKLYVTGVTRDEGSYLLLKDNALSVVNYHVNYMYFKQKIREYIKMYNYTQNAEGIYNAVLYAYTNWADPKNDTLVREGYIHMLSDSVYNAPVDYMTKLLVEQGVRTHMYLMNSTVESLGKPYWQAVPHNTELNFISGAPFLDDKYFPFVDPNSRSSSWTEEDRKMSALMMTLWSNIAKYRNPTFSNVPYIVWKPMEQHVNLYLSLNTTKYSYMNRDYRQKESAFWYAYMPTLWGPPPPTQPPYMQMWYQYEHPLQIGFWTAISLSAVLLILLVAMCCCYCRISRNNKTMDIDFDGSLPPDDYSLTHPITTNTKNEKSDASHTPV
ncbi:hypothetical protein CHUAL_007244 [Chamberlinius hualienensis]